MAAIHIAPAVANHPALSKINAQLARGAQQHAGLRLAAVAVRLALAGVETNLNAVNRQLRQQMRVNHFDDFPFQSAAPNVWLVRRNDKKESGSFQFCASSGDFRKDFKFVQISRRERLMVALQRPIDDAVAV